MSFVHSALRWQSKPDLPGQINHQHQLARGLVFYGLDCRGIVYSLIRPGVAQTPGVRPPASSFGNAMVGNSGLHAAGVTDGQYFDQALYPEIKITGDKSWAAGVYKTASTGQWARPFCRTANHGSSAPYANFDFEINPAGDGQGRIKWLVATTGTSMVESEPAFDVIADNVYYTISASAQLNANMLGYTQGVQRTSAGVTSLDSYDTNAHLVIGGDNDAGSAQWVGAVPWIAIWNRVLSADEMLLLHREPYALLAPRIRRTCFTTGSAYTDTIAESTASTDAAAVGLAALNTLAESASLADVAAGTWAATSTLAESAGASDAAAGTWAATSSVTETAALADTAAYSLAFVLTIAETASLADAAAVGLAFTSTLAESTGAADAAVAGLLLANSIAETASLADAAVVGLVLLNTLAEGLSVSDAVATVWTGTAALAESAAATDPAAGGFSTVATAADAMAIADLIAVFGGYAYPTAPPATWTDTTPPPAGSWTPATPPSTTWS